MRKLFEKAGAKSFRFHAIRHLTAVTLCKAGKPVSVIRKILPRQHPTRTERYFSRFDFEMEEMKKALQVLSNRKPNKGKAIPFVPNAEASQAAN